MEKAGGPCHQSNIKGTSKPARPRQIPTRTRRSRRKKRLYEAFRVYYVNIRGLKSKTKSLKDIIDAKNPTVLCIAETHLQGNERVKIPGYKVITNNNKSNKGGVLIGIKESLEPVTIEVKSEQDTHESLWIKIDNGKNKIRLGIIYAPQENKSTVQTLQSMYNSIEEEIKTADRNDENLMIVGDFNCKVGAAIPGNREEITKSGKLLCNLIKKWKLDLVNSLPVCEGKWTRIEKETKTIIDYAITRTRDRDGMSLALIDEEKTITPYRISDKIVYSDHCAILMEINWAKTNFAKAKSRKVINMKQLRAKTENAGLNEIAQGKGSIKSLYTGWQGKLNEIIESCSRVQKNKKSKLKAVRILMKEKRKTKKERLAERDKKKRRLLLVKERLIDEFIVKENKIEQGNKIKKVADDIKRKGGVKSGAFWDFKKKIDGPKTSARTAIKGKNGQIIEDIEAIKEEYKEFYKDILTVKSATTWEEKLAEEINNTIHGCLEASEFMKKCKVEKTTRAELDFYIKKIKKKHTRDRQGMSNAMVKIMGKDFIDSLLTLINKIEESPVIPDEWDEMEILSFHKNKGSKLELENRRGIFITNTISKLFEKIRSGKTREKLRDKISEFQCGGIEDRSTADHLITLNSVIAYNKYLGAPTHIWFGDAYKCFDKLCLKDCIKELGKIVGWEEARLIHQMNRNGRAVINCPAGETDAIRLQENVRQGTIFGPKLCAISTDKVNSISRKTVTLLRDVAIESVIFVDDIMFPSTRKEGIETAIGNCHSLETLKKFTFSVRSDKSGILTIGGTKKDREIEFKGKLGNGLVNKTKEYKYLGEWYNEKGNNDLSIQKRKEKVDYMLHEILRYGDKEKVGNMALEVRIKIYETVVVPTLFANIETWGRVSEKDLKELERLQAKVLRGMFRQIATTPYWGLLAEVGIWPVENRIEYKKIMLFHNIVTSDEKRLARKLVEDQIRSPYNNCWGESIIDICRKYDIDVEQVKFYKKKALKKEIKEKIEKEINKSIESKKQEMSKLRFVDDKGRKEYITKLTTEAAIRIMKARLNMLDLRANYKGKHERWACQLCNMGEDSTEHLFECKGLERIRDVTITVESLTDPDERLSNFIKRAMQLKQM